MRLSIYESRIGLDSFSRDPIGYMGSEWSLYEFLDGRALSNVDPFGNESWFPFPNQGNCYINPITGQRICSPGQPILPTHVGPVRHTGNKRCIFEMAGMVPNRGNYPKESLFQSELI